MFEWLKRKSLTSALRATRRLLVKGVVFEIQKISVDHYAEGAQVLRRTVDTYKAGKDAPEIRDNHFKKVKEHYADVILAGVVSPKLKRKQDEPVGIWIEDLFVDWEMCEELYEAIAEMTYGKKKFRSAALREQS